MRFSSAIKLLGIMFLAGCTSSSVSTEYFQVSGSTEKQLDRSFALNAPMNGHAFAATELQILPVTLDPIQDQAGCYFRKATFKIKARILYPQWKDRKGASSDLKRGFDAFARYARIHEQIHVQIGEAAARTMGREVEAIPPQRDCDRLLAKFKTVVKSVYAKHEKAQKAFDAAETKRLRKLFAASAG